MYLLLRFFNSVIFLLVNFSFVLCICQRFFRIMKNHHQLVAEASEFEEMVRQARSSVNYIGEKVSEATKEIKGDFESEVEITTRLTNLHARVKRLTNHFAILEEAAIEGIRMDHNKESVKTETPSDINTRVDEAIKTMLVSNEASHHTLQEKRRKKRISLPLTKFSVAANCSGTANTLENPDSAAKSVRNRSTIPEVTLLEEKKAPVSFLYSFDE